ncbi:MAG: hypothetical protein AAFY34_03345 [Pseudomonadota bacterium]
MKIHIVPAVLLITSILAGPRAYTQIDNDVKIVEEYALLGNQLDDIIAAWNTLLEHKDLLESQGYTLKPECFTHTRTKWINIKTGVILTRLNFVTKRKYPEGCANSGTFYLIRDDAEGEWMCKISTSLRTPLRDCHLGRE